MPRLAVALFACLLLTAPAASAATWSPPERISEGAASGLNEAPAMGADGNGRIIVAWKDCPADQTCRIMSSTRTAAGNWTAPELIAQDPDNGLHAPVVAVSRAGDAAIAFTSCHGSMDCATELALRPRDEASFRPAVEVSARMWLDGGPAVVVTEEGEVTVAWEHIATGESYQTVRARTITPDESPDTAGETAGPIHTLSSFDTDGEQDAHPQLVVGEDGVVTAAWVRQFGSSEVMSARQLSTGAWTGDERIGLDDPAGWRELKPVLMSGSGDEVFIAYVRQRYDNMTNTTQGTLHLARRAGGSWATPVQLADYGSEAQNNFVAGASGAPGELGVLYSGFRYIEGADGGIRPVSDMNFIRRDPATGGWSEPVSVGITTDFSQPKMAMDDLGTATVVHQPLDPEGKHLPGLGVARITRDGDRSGTAVLSSGEQGDGFPAVATTPDGTAAVAWPAFEDQGVFVDASVIGPVAPKASFTVTPAAPVAGEAVTFKSTSTDEEGTIASHAWDLDDDGDFDDATGATAKATFGAGEHTVGLRVVDDGDRSSTAEQTFTVKPAPVTDPNTGGGGTGGGEAPSTPAGGTPPLTPAPVDPVGFVPGDRTDTEGRRTMPNVVGRDLAAAKALITRALLYADIKATSKIAKASSLPKRPGGGRWELGDVIAQTPAAKAAVTSATDQQAPVALTFWAGERNDRKRCDEIRAEVKGDDLAAAEQQLKAAGCKKPDYEYVASKKAAEVEVKKADKDGDVTVTVPADLAKLDLRVWVSGGPVVETSPGPGKNDFSLTAGQNNAIGLIVYDRANRPMRDARVRFDLHETGGRDLLRPTDASGVAYGVVSPQKRGVIHAFVEWADRKGEKLYGYAAITVLDRSREKEFTTLVGHTWRNDGSRFRFAGKSTKVLARAASLGNLWGALADALAGFGGRVAEIVRGAGAEAEKLITVARSFRISAQQLWAGQPTNGNFRAGELTRAGSGVWRLEPNGVVSAGGANVVAAGGANVVAAGGANLIGAAAANVVSAGGANVVSAGGANVLAVKGGHLISDNGLGLQAGQGDIVRLPDGARVVSAGGANVVAAGGANLIGAAAGN